MTVETDRKHGDRKEDDAILHYVSQLSGYKDARLTTSLEKKSNTPTNVTKVVK